LTPDAVDETLVEVAAELFDSFGLLATSDTNAVSFRVAYGSGVLAGPEQVLPQEGRAQTWLRLGQKKTEVVVEAWSGEVRQKAGSKWASQIWGLLYARAG
jgi:hypothetical protein